MNRFGTYENTNYINSKVPIEIGYYSAEKKEDLFIIHGNSAQLDVPLNNEILNGNYRKPENGVGLTLYPQDYLSTNFEKQAKYNSLGKQSNDSVDHINPEFYEMKNFEYELDYENKQGFNDMMGESGTASVNNNYQSNGVMGNVNYDSNNYEQFIANDQNKDKAQNCKMEIENY